MSFGSRRPRLRRTRFACPRRRPSPPHAVDTLPPARGFDSGRAARAPAVAGRPDAAGRYRGMVVFARIDSRPSWAGVGSFSFGMTMLALRRMRSLLFAT